MSLRLTVLRDSYQIKIYHKKGGTSVSHIMLILTAPGFLSRTQQKLDFCIRVVSKEEGEKCARKFQMMFIEASAKTNEGVKRAFEELVKKVIQTPDLWESCEKRGMKVAAGPEGSKEGKRGCC